MLAHRSIGEGLGAAEMTSGGRLSRGPAAAQSFDL
jgi:hypothetical protein